MSFSHVQGEGGVRETIERFQVGVYGAVGVKSGGIFCMVVFFLDSILFLEFSGRGVYCYGHVGDNLDALFYLVDRAHYSAGFGV